MREVYICRKHTYIYLKWTQDMNLSAYILNKGMEKLVIEATKELILNDKTIPRQQRKNMISVIDICSTAKDVQDLMGMARKT